MQLKDQDYLEGLKSGDDAMLRALYDRFLPPVVRLVENNSGGRDDALDIFQEAVIVLYRKVRQEDFTLTSALSTYIYAICRNQWMKRLNKKSFSEVSIEDDGVYTSSENFITEMETQEKYRLFKNKLAILGEDCRRILELFLNGISM
jgi:RNA polymerase sigma factor (sigma-70 family)